jgi:predicted transcriptional regulator
MSYKFEINKRHQLLKKKLLQMQPLVIQNINNVGKHEKKVREERILEDLILREKEDKIKIKTKDF